MESEILYPLLEKAEKLKLSGEHMEAIRFCQEILLQDLDVTEAYEEIGDNYISLGEYPKAVKALVHALKLNPMSANANYLIGFLHSTQQNWGEAVNFLEYANELFPNHPEILRCLGWAIFHNGFKKKGLFVLERALTISPEDSYILCDLGVCYMNQRNFPRALHLFQKTLNVDPDNLKARECMRIAELFADEESSLA
jgi:tetratricopeptide (TPR) repeat protein